jgi:NadR type nicotinamide-nucleotide adenylyltransferase
MLKVAILGPESTGKSALTEQLAAYYHADYVLEYAREYVEKLKVSYTYQDVCNIAHHQIEQELAFESSECKSEMVIFDTDLIFTKVWFDHCYQSVPDFVSHRLQKGFFDVYLLCTPDIPWVPDPVREHGHDREYFFDWYQREIELLNKPYHIISGIGEHRLQSAIKVLEALK